MRAEPQDSSTVCTIRVVRQKDVGLLPKKPSKVASGVKKFLLLVTLVALVILGLPGQATADAGMPGVLAKGRYDIAIIAVAGPGQASQATVENSSYIVSTIDARYNTVTKGNYRFRLAGVQNVTIPSAAIEGFCSIDIYQRESEKLGVRPPSVTPGSVGVIPVYVLPVTTHCQAAALGRMADRGVAIYQLWASPISTGVTMLAHELGHNLGLGHARATANPEKIKPPVFPADIKEYGDMASLMGSDYSKLWIFSPVDLLELKIATGKKAALGKKTVLTPYTSGGKILTIADPSRAGGTWTVTYVKPGTVKTDIFNVYTGVTIHYRAPWYVSAVKLSQGKARIKAGKTVKLPGGRSVKVVSETRNNATVVVK